MKDPNPRLIISLMVSILCNIGMIISVVLTATAVGLNSESIARDKQWKVIVDDCVAALNENTAQFDDITRKMRGNQ